MKFPEVLDMSPYCEPGVIGGTQYSLCGVINHHGSFGGGHYTSYARHCESGQWLLCDDSRVFKAPIEDVLSSQAYILFYQKYDPETAGRRSLLLQEWRRRVSCASFFSLSLSLSLCEGRLS